MHLITPSLLNNFAYYLSFEGETTEDEGGIVITAEEKEAKQRAEFLTMLRREKTPNTEDQQRGLDFEAQIQEHCEGAPDNDPVIQEIGAIVKGGMWQQSMKLEFGEFLLYARADVIKRDTIYDIKRPRSGGNYEPGKYAQSAQHRIEFLCSGMPKFSYIISDGRNWWREDYFNHAGIEQEIRAMIREFTGYLENDPEAKALYYSNWQALEKAA